MTWLWIPLVAALFYALSGFIDNFVADTYTKKLNGKCAAIIYAIIDLSVCVGIAIATRGAVFQGVNWLTIGILFLAALINFCGSMPYYKALKGDDTTEVTLLGQIAPVMALALGYFLLHENIAPMQLVAFFLILGTAVAMIMTSGRRHLKLKATAGGYVALACFFWVLSDIIFVTQAREMDFTTSFFWIIALGGLINIGAFAIMKSWRRDFQTFWKRKRGRKLLTLLANETLWFGGEVLWRYGVIVMPVAIMSVTGNVAQLIVTFILGVFLTMLFPRFGREKLNKKQVRNHAFATGVVAIAVVLLG